MIIIGFDPGIAKPAMACFKNGEIKTFAIRVNKLHDLDERVLNIGAEVILREDWVDLVVIEGISHGCKFGVAGLAVVSYEIRRQANLKGFKTLTVNPAALKKFATGRGNAKKPEMAVAAFKDSGVEFTDDNQCDAYWLCRIGQEIMNPNPALPKYRREILDKLQIPDGKKEKI